MHRVSVVLLLLLAALLSRAEHPLVYESPTRFADEVAEVAFAGDDGGEAASSAGSDLRADRRVIDRSTLIRTLVGFPQDFLDGLVAEERNGYVSYPISVRIDPVSGCALFENAASRVFYAIAPADGAWTPPAAACVEIRWRVLPDGIPGSRNPENRNPGIPTSRNSAETLRFDSITCATNGVSLSAAWSASDAPTNGVLDLYFSTHLDRDWRLLKTMAIPVGATNLTTFLAITDIPSYTNLPPAHVHDADCHIVTNISPNIFSGGSVVTNIHWSCAGQRIPPYEGDSGFFRLGTRDDTDGDGLPDAYERIVSGTDPLLADSDGDGLWDDGELDAGTDPLNPDTDGDGLGDGDELGSAHRLPVFIWHDASGGTNLLASFTSPVDYRAWPLPLSRPLSLDSNVFNRIEVDVDGYLHLLSTNSIPIYAGMSFPWVPFGWKPEAYATNEMLLAACAIDWMARPSLDDSRILVAEDPAEESLVIEWRNVRHHSYTPTATFQASIHPDYPGAVLFSYQSISNAIGNEAVVVGIQNRLRHDFAHPSYFQTSLWNYHALHAVSDGMSVLVRPGTGTDPLSADTDADGLSDPSELHVHRTDPLSPDTDGDGVPDGAEVSLGINPRSPDTDGDTMPDGWEMSFGFDPGDSSDAVLDADSDGIPNAGEHGFGTDPTLPDTDEDGLGDYAETPHLRIVPAETVPWFDLPESARLTPTNDVFTGLFSFPLASPLSLCGIVCTNVLADVNGLVTFPDARRVATRGSRPVNQDLSVSTIWQNDCFVAAYWDNLQLRPALGSALYAANVATNGETYCVLEYRNVGFTFHATDSVTFQLSFAYGSPTNAIRVRYGEIRDSQHGGSATFGLQGSGRCVAECLSFNAPFNVSGLAILHEFGTGTWPWQSDTDSDGSSDAEEIAVGTNPRSPDTDGDGMSDAWESANGLNPFSPLGDDGWAGDPDGDGRSNGQEFVRGTSPVLCDTDGDGIPDGYSGSAWTNHVLRASVVGATNVLVSYSATVPVGGSCALRVGTLTVPLSGSGTLALFLDPGTAYPFRLASTGGAVASLSLLDPRTSQDPPLRNTPAEPEPPLWLDDPLGVFSDETANGSGTLAVPVLHLVDERGQETETGECIHDPAWTVTRTYAFHADPEEMGLTVGDLSVEGFSVEGPHSLSLTLEGNWPIAATGTVSVLPAKLKRGLLATSRSIHRCIGASDYHLCHACGFRHSWADSCSHASGCAAAIDPMADCSCDLWLQVAWRDLDGNGVPDGQDSHFVSNAASVVFTALGSTLHDCCCGYGAGGADFVTARLVSHSPNLRLWDGAGNRLHVGDTMETFMVQAATPSPSVGGSEVAYQIVGPTNDVRRTIHIHVTAWDMWNTGLSFNFATNAHAIDAINLRHGYATNLVIDYTLPEWEAPTNHAAVPARNEPACWIAGTTPLVKGRFVVRPTDITNAVLHADHSGTILSAIPPTSVVLSNGVTRTLPLLSHPDHVSFPLASPIPTVVSRSTNEVWTWRAESLNGHDVGDALIATNGPSIAYSILGAPVAPWTDIGGSQTNVWTSALDFVITNACEGATSETNALAELTQFLFSGHGLEYDKDSGDSSYTSGTAGWFDVTGYVNKSAKQSVHRYPRPGNVVNCYDQAAALTIFGRVIGIDSQYRLQQPFGYLNMVALVGIGDCNNPFYKSDVAKKTVGHDDSRTSFRNHAFVTFGVNVFDACGGPETGINTLPIYLNNLIDRSTLWESASAAPTNAVPFTFDFLKLK